MDDSLNDFLKHFKRDKCYDIKHVDLGKLKGAMVISRDIKVYRDCSFLGIRTIGYTYEGDTIYSDIQKLDTEIESHFSDPCVTVIIFDRANISASITEDELDALYKKYFDQGRVIFINGRDSLEYLIYAVNEFRSVDPSYC